MLSHRNGILMPSHIHMTDIEHTYRETLEEAKREVCAIIERSETDLWRRILDRGEEIEYKLTIKAGSPTGYRMSLSTQTKLPNRPIVTFNRIS